MKQYVQVMKTSWQRAFAYKTNFMVSSLLNVLRVIAEAIFWVAFFQISKKSNINGYTLPLMLTYYILLFIVSTLINMGDVGANIATDIKNGTLSQYIVKPLNYMGYYFSETLSKRILDVCIALIVFIPVFAAFFSRLVLEVQTWQLFFLPLVLILSLVLNFLLNVLIGYLAFWFTELTSFFFMKDVLLGFISGAVVPIDLLPESVFSVMSGLPFMYIIYFPVKILNKGVDFKELIIGIGMQVLWIFIFYVLIKILWRTGIRKYSGTGM